MKTLTCEEKFDEIDNKLDRISTDLFAISADVWEKAAPKCQKTTSQNNTDLPLMIIAGLLYSLKS